MHINLSLSLFVLLVFKALLETQGCLVIYSDILACIQRMLPYLGPNAPGGFKVDFGKYLAGQSIGSLFFVRRNL